MSRRVCANAKLREREVGVAEHSNQSASDKLMYLTKVHTGFNDVFGWNAECERRYRASYHGHVYDIEMAMCAKYEGYGCHDESFDEAVRTHP